MNDHESEQTIVFDFGSDAESWPNIDNPVMGGLSRSTMRREASTSSRPAAVVALG